MNWLPHDSPARFRWISDCKRYSISAMKPIDEVEMPWWEAKHAEGNDIASGYGDSGLEKCKRYCQRHSEIYRDAPAPAPGFEFQRVTITESLSVTAAADLPVPQQALF